MLLSKVDLQVLGSQLRYHDTKYSENLIVHVKHLKEGTKCARM